MLRSVGNLVDEADAIDELRQVGDTELLLNGKPKPNTAEAARHLRGLCRGQAQHELLGKRNAIEIGHGTIGARWAMRALVGDMGGKKGVLRVP